MQLDSIAARSESHPVTPSYSQRSPPDPATPGCWTPRTPCTSRLPQRRRRWLQWMVRPSHPPQRAARTRPAPASPPPASFLRRPARAWTAPGSELAHCVYRACTASTPHRCSAAGVLMSTCGWRRQRCPAQCMAFHLVAQPGLQRAQQHRMRAMQARLLAARVPRCLNLNTFRRFSTQGCGSWPPLSCPAQH